MDLRPLAEYTRAPIVRDRNYVALVLWAAGATAQPVPATRPSDDWVRARLLAERIPQTPDYYVQRTLAYFLQAPTTRSDIALLLEPANAARAEDLLDIHLAAVIGGFIARFAPTEIAPPQVQAWLTEHGF